MYVVNSHFVILGLIEYNFHVIKDGLQKMLELNQKHERDDLGILDPTDPTHIDSEHQSDRVLDAGDANNGEDDEDGNEEEDNDNHANPRGPPIHQSRDLGPLLC